MAGRGRDAAARPVEWEEKKYSYEPKVAHATVKKWNPPRTGFPSRAGVLSLTYGSTLRRGTTLAHLYATDLSVRRVRGHPIKQ